MRGEGQDERGDEHVEHTRLGMFLQLSCVREEGQGEGGSKY